MNTKQQTEFFVTNGQFFQVVKRTPKMVTLRPVKAEQVGSEQGHPFLYTTPCKPIKEAWTEAYINYRWTDKEFSRKFDGFFVRIDNYRFATPWNGKSYNFETNLG